MHDVMPRLFETAFPAKGDKHRLRVAWRNLIFEFHALCAEARSFDGERRPCLAAANPDLASVILANQSVVQPFTRDYRGAPSIRRNEEFTLDFDRHVTS